MPRKTFTFEGKRYDITAKDQDELNEKVRDKKKELKDGSMLVDSSMIVSVWAQKWLNTYKNKSLSPDTRKDYLARLNRHILPHIGGMKIRDVRPIHCQNILNKMDGYSKDRILKVKNTMYQMFKKAVTNRMIAYNPADDLEIPYEATDGKGRALTEYERKILFTVNHRLSLWARTMVYCGLRPGETARLLGTHIDFKNKKIYIDGTKTKNAKRYVPLPDELIPELRALNVKPFEYVFKGENGKPLTSNTITRGWHNLWREMNIIAGTKVYRNELKEPYKIPKDCIAYCCRHSFATDCKDAKIPWGIIKELLGHSSGDVTETYVESTEKSLKIAADLLRKHRKKHPDLPLEVSVRAVNVQK